MDYASENGENFYSPAPPPEQIIEQEKAVSQTIASLPILKQLIEDFEKFYDEAQSIQGIALTSDVSVQAQIIAKTEIGYWCKDHLDHYRALYESVQPSNGDIL